MSKRRKHLGASLTILGVITVAGVGAVANAFYNLTLKRRHKIGSARRETMTAKIQKNHNLNALPILKDTSDIGQHIEKSTAWLKRSADDLFIDSRDNLRLHALRIKANTNKYVIICHGYGHSAVNMASYAYRFFQRGYNLLLPDARGHGESEGDYIGMGWPERLDILEWIRRILCENATAKIVLFGLSMGAATIMMAVGEELPNNVKLVIEDCGYSSVWDQFSHNLRDIFHLPRFPVMYASSSISRLRSGYGFKEASAVEQLKKSKLPILLIHGDQDNFVPFEMQDILFNASVSVDKEKLVIHNAGHGNAAAVDSGLYWSTIDNFLKKYNL